MLFLNEKASRLTFPGFPSHLAMAGTLGNRLLEAVESKDHVLMDTILADPALGDDLNFQDDDVMGGLTPLHMAAFNNDRVALDKLLSKGAVVNVQDKYGYTPLHITAYKQQVGACQALLDLGADPNMLNSFKQTPLDGAEATAAELTVALLKPLTSEQALSRPTSPKITASKRLSSPLSPISPSKDDRNSQQQ